MVIGTTPRRPAIPAPVRGNRQVVDASDPQAHETVLIELPVFIAITAKPIAAVIVPLIGKTDGDSILAKRPQLLDQPIVELANPFARQERLDRAAALQKFGAIAPAAVRAVGKRDST